MSQFRVCYPGESPITLSVDDFAGFRESRYVDSCGDVPDVLECYFSDSMRVDDVQRYTICWGTGADTPSIRCNSTRDDRFAYSRFCDQLPERREGQSVVLLLLESPHKNEYKYDPEPESLQSIAPAQGATGNNIQRHFPEVLKCGLSPALCDGASVVIANPIPYQTSLVSISDEPRKWRPVRDAVWAALWNNRVVKAHFAERLRQYNPHVVINACTSARSPDLPYTYSVHVAKFVAAQYPTAKLFTTTHPFSWWRASCRRLKPVS